MFGFPLAGEGGACAAAGVTAAQAMARTGPVTMAKAHNFLCFVRICFPLLLAACAGRGCPVLIPYGSGSGWHATVNDLLEKSNATPAPMVQSSPIAPI